MSFSLVILAIFVLSGEARNILSSVSKDGQSLNLRKLRAVRIENREPRDDGTMLKTSSASAPSPHMNKGETREKREVSLLNIPQLTIAANLPNQSVCHWTYRIDSDANRRPVDLVEAVCIQPNGTDDVCLRIFYFIPVQVKMTSPDGVVTWVDKLEKKVVGCTLAAPLQAMTMDDDDSMATRD